MEVAAGAIAAEQAISTTLEGAAVAAVALSKSTLPLKGTFTRFALAPTGDGRSSLARSHHTATVLHGKLYIFGGLTGPDIPATNDIHIITLPDVGTVETEYQCIPPLAEYDGEVLPAALIGHEACSIGDSIFFYNGKTPNEPENLRIWEFKTTTLRWRETSLADNAQLAQRIGTGERSSFPPTEGKNSLVTSTLDATYVLDQSQEHVNSIHHLDKQVENAVWQSIHFPIAAEAGQESTFPSARNGAKILKISTGHGRNYLILLPGTSFATSSDPMPDIWALQLPSDDKSATNLKDQVRDTLDSKNVPGSQTLLGGDSGKFSWGRVEIEAKAAEAGSAGKSLPGPLSFYAADVIGDSRIVIWGGVDAKGEQSAEGWILDLR